MLDQVELAALVTSRMGQVGPFEWFGVWPFGCVVSFVEGVASQYE